MKNVGQFKKVSFEKFFSECKKYNLIAQDCDEASIRELYDTMALPRRGTPGSAGYDIVFPLEALSIRPGSSAIIPTGIKIRIDVPDYYLKVVPKSGLSRRYRTAIVGTEGIIDADYYYSEAEGQIMIELINNSASGEVLHLTHNFKFCQGILSEYGTTVDDDPVEAIRVNGFGSTGETLK